VPAQPLSSYRSLSRYRSLSCYRSLSLSKGHPGNAPLPASFSVPELVEGPAQ
jgi:hypothetical protein